MTLSHLCFPGVEFLCSVRTLGKTHYSLFLWLDLWVGCVCVSWVGIFLMGEMVSVCAHDASWELINDFYFFLGVFVSQSFKEDRERDMEREWNLINCDSNASNGETAWLQVSITVHTNRLVQTFFKVRLNLNDFIMCQRQLALVVGKDFLSKRRQDYNFSMEFYVSGTF